MLVLKEMVEHTATTYAGVYYLVAWVFTVHAIVLVTEPLVPEWKDKYDESYTWFIIATIWITMMFLYDDVALHEGITAFIFSLCLPGTLYKEWALVYLNRTVFPMWRILLGMFSIGIHIVGIAVLVISYFL